MVRGLDPAKMERLVHEIAENYNPSVMVLHGSAAKGVFVEKVSDIDIIVISPRFKDVDPRERFIRLLEICQKHVRRVEALGYTPHEFVEMIDRLNFFALDAVYYGLPLYDEGNIWSTILEGFNKVKNRYGLKKTETDGWSFKEP